MTLLIEIQYFPSVILYKNLYNFSNIVFERCETYQKAGFRNRCQIAGAEGVVDLSVPLLNGREQKTVVRDIRIFNRQPWGARHWKAIMSCYSRSPWFDHYREDLAGLYRRKWDWLLDWDLACFEWSLKALGMQMRAGLTDEWLREYDTGKVSDWRGRLTRGKVGAKLVGEADKGGEGDGDGKGDWEGDREGDRGGDWNGVKRYRQVFEERTGFLPNLSILDLIFCEGRQAIKYIRSS